MTTKIHKLYMVPYYLHLDHLVDHQNISLLRNNDTQFFFFKGKKDKAHTNGQKKVLTATFSKATTG